MINEGGSVEIDGNGVLMACKSSILNNNRNPGMTQQQAEAIFTKTSGNQIYLAEWKSRSGYHRHASIGLPDLLIHLPLSQ